SLFEDRQHTLWIGTTSGLAQMRDGRIKAIPAEPFRGTQIWAITADRDNNIWIGTFGRGLLRYTNGIYSKFATKDGLTSEMVSALYEDREGNLWIGTNGGGLNRMRDVTFTTYTTR